MIRKLNLLMAADENYAQHMGVALLSALENAGNPNMFSITVLDGGISDMNKLLIKDMVEAYGSSISFKLLTLENAHNFIVSGHISLAAYYRIMLPQVYDTSTDKIIYLDCDVIVNYDLEKLYEIDLDEFVVGAVPELSNVRMEDFGYPDKPYFNSGVLLINYQQWLKQGVTNTVLEFIYNYPQKLVYWDQDALNACLVDKWLPLDIRWNYFRDFVVKNKNWKDNRTFLPYIVHYTNNTKPWHYASRNPYDYLYFTYLKKSPWSGATPNGRTVKRILSKHIKLSLRGFNLMDTM